MYVGSILSILLVLFLVAARDHLGVQLIFDITIYKRLFERPVDLRSTRSRPPPDPARRSAPYLLQLLPSALCVGFLLFLVFARGTSF